MWLLKVVRGAYGTSYRRLECQQRHATNVCWCPLQGATVTVTVSFSVVVVVTVTVKIWLGAIGVTISGVSDVLDDTGPGVFDEAPGS